MKHPLQSKFVVTIRTNFGKWCVVHYEGSEEDWQLVTVGYGNTPLKDASKINYNTTK
jgi:hypothetical protein